MSEAKISIVVPSYNQAQYLEWTLRSVIFQRYAPTELVVMDGGSNDGTIDILRRYEKYFHYWRSAPDGGQAAAIEQGFRHSTGSIMAYLNSDDMLAPDTLHWVNEFFNHHPNVDVVYSNRCAVDSANKVIWHWILPRHTDYLMMRWDLIPQETCFWRRRIYEKTGGIDASFHFAMDYDLFVRFMRQGRLFHARRFLGAFRQHSDSKTSRQLNDLGQQEIRRVWRKYGIRAHRWDATVGVAFQRGVELRSYLFSSTERELTGARPGVGFNFDELWGGQLQSRHLPA